MSEFIEKLRRIIYSYRYCHFCGKEVGTFYRYKCSYCHRGFCPDHRLPEDHNCRAKDKLKSPEGGLRELHDAKGGMTAKGVGEQ